MMRITRTRFPYSLHLAAITILLALNFMAPHVRASSPWIEVHPPEIEGLFTHVRSVHFSDSDTGFAVVHDRLTHWPEDWLSIVLRTTDGGRTWRQGAPVDDAFGFGIHFISPMIGWRSVKYPKNTAPPNLLADLQFFQTADGGLTWNLRHGKVTELIDISGLDFPPRKAPEWLRRLLTTHIYFVDERHGWLLGYCRGWSERYVDVRLPDNDPGDARAPKLTANYIYSTRDGGQTWKCHVDVYETIGDAGRSPVIDAGIRRPRDMDFVDSRVGWVAAPLVSYGPVKPFGKWMYRTVDEGNTWHWLDQPNQFAPDEFLETNAIEFVDRRRGWAVGDGVWFTDDGGETWTKKFSGLFTAIHFENSNEGWIAGVELPSEGWSREAPPNKIYHTVDGGISWEIEWVAPESYQAIRHISYHAVTNSLWAGGSNGRVLMRPMIVSPRGKLATLWGKLKAGGDTNR